MKHLDAPAAAMNLPAGPRLSLAHREALWGNPWFAALSTSQRDGLLAASGLLHYKRGAPIYRRGDPATAAGSALHGLVNGAVKLSTLQQDGREAILGVLEPGAWFGEVSLIDGQPRSHDATAATPVELISVPAQAFAQLMTDPLFANAMALLLAGRVRALYALKEDVNPRSLRVRLARRLLTLGQGDAIRGSTPHGEIRLSQETLAMMLGVTRQSLSLELNALSRAGLIALGYGSIRLLSLEDLEALGES